MSKTAAIIDEALAGASAVNSFQNSSVAGVGEACTMVVAGGQGRRIGGHKADIILCEDRLIDHVLVRADQWELPVFIQVRSSQQVKTPGYEQVLDDPHIGGPLSGIIAGLRYAKRQGFAYALSVGCDMPFLPRDLVDWLLPAARETGKIAMARSGETLHPICAVWPVACLSALEQSAARGDLSLKHASKSFGRVALDWPDSPIHPFFNINTE